MDSPVAYHFWEYYLSYTNARFILTTRNSSDYVKSRIQHHKTSPPMIPRPCKLLMKSLSINENEKVFELHQEFVRCVIPEDQLLDICVVCGNVTYGILADWMGVDVPEHRQYDEKLPHLG